MRKGLPLVLVGDGRGERMRWRIADLLNRLPGQCWADLVAWALYASSDRDDHPWWRPSQPTSAGCREDARRCGSCWCGKFQDESAWLRREAELGDPWAAP